MKRIFLFIMILMLCGGFSFAQSVDKIAKERAELMKLSKKQLSQRASKTARKEAKRMRKEGWKTTPGSLPLDKQLDKSYLMQYEFDENMFPKYIMGEAMSIGENYDAAKMQALELAKQNLVGQIQAEITALIENTVANKQLSNEQAASIAQSVQSSKSLISQRIGRTMPVIEVYRVVSNGNKEVLLRIAYSSQMVREAAKNAIREDLGQKGEDLHEQLDELLDW